MFADEPLRMSADVDGPTILSALARNPSAFGMAKPQVDAIATAAVRASLKEKSITIEVLRSMVDAIGDHDLDVIVGGLPAKDARSLARLDDKHPEFATASDQWHRAHVMKLARGDAEPASNSHASRVPKILRSARAPASATGKRVSKIGKIMASQAQATATRARKQRGAR